MVEVRIAEKIEEYEAAFELASSVFCRTEEDFERKRLSWQEAGMTNLESLVIAVGGHDVIGLVRICPTLMYWRNHRYETAALSSICVSPEHQGRGIGRMLMEHTIKHCDNMGLDFTFLIARRAVDHFYTRFGFFGASSYQSLEIRGKPSAYKYKIEFKSFNEANVALYSEWYNACYFDSFGRTHRKKEYWIKANRRLALSELTFEEIHVDSRLVGYLVSNGLSIIELSYDTNIDDSMLSNLISRLLEQGDEILNLTLPHHHAITDMLDDYDVLFLSRRCLYGGQMMRWSSTRKKGRLEISIGVASPKRPGDVPFFSISQLDEI